MRSALIQLLLAVGVSSQKFPNALNASQIDISCFPSKYQVQWQINDPVIVLVSDEWWPAAVTAINYNISTSEDVNSDASDIKPSWFQVRWSSGVPPGTSNEMAVGIDVVQKNDILDCFLLRGLCHSARRVANGDRDKMCMRMGRSRRMLKGYGLVSRCSLQSFAPGL